MVSFECRNLKMTLPLSVSGLNGPSSGFGQMWIGYGEIYFRLKTSARGILGKFSIWNRIHRVVILNYPNADFEENLHIRICLAVGEWVVPAYLKMKIVGLSSYTGLPISQFYFISFQDGRRGERDDGEAAGRPIFHLCGQKNCGPGDDGHSSHHCQRQSTQVGT